MPIICSSFKVEFSINEELSIYYNVIIIDSKSARTSNLNLCFQYVLGYQVVKEIAQKKSHPC